MSAPQIPAGDNVVLFPTARQRTRPVLPADPFRELTYQLVMKQAREGALDPNVVDYLMTGLGIGGAV
jgi:hypothetical protein